MKRKAAYLQVTRECNNECVFCSNPQFDKEYTFDDAKKTVMQLKKEGITEIFLTGGEPTISPFLPELIKFIEEKGIEPRLITNGVELSNKNLARRLYDVGLRSVNCSIHSHMQEIADSLSQRKGHFEKTLQGIRNAIDAGMQVQINSTINSRNCKNLLDFARFITEKFPSIEHFVFNNLDPSKADGVLKSRAGENPWIVARFVDFELSLNQMVKFLLSNGKTFRIERVPLCYMQGFEEFSTETRKIVKEELYICSFIEKNKKSKIRIVEPSQLRVKADCCKYCRLNTLCAGIQQEYIDIHGSNEFFPVFSDSKEIINKIKNEENK